MSIDEILAYIKQFSPIKNILITGGEPLLQNDLYYLIEKLNLRKYKIFIETNGSILIDKIQEYVTKIVDVKCPDSNERDSFILDNLNYMDFDKDQLKFVISSQKDYIWAKNFIKIHDLFGNNILFSAAWAKYSYLDLVNNILSDKLNVRFQPQIHKFIWSPEKKGV